MRFLGRKLRCLSSAWTRGDRQSVCIRYAETSQFNCELIGRFSHRNSYPLICSCDNHVRTYSNDCNWILSQSALRSWEPAARELGAGDEGPGRARRARRARFKRMAPSLAIGRKYRGLHPGWETARG